MSEQVLSVIAVTRSLSVGALSCVSIIAQITSKLAMQSAAEQLLNYCNEPNLRVSYFFTVSTF